MNEEALTLRKDVAGRCLFRQPAEILTSPWLLWHLMVYRSSQPRFWPAADETRLTPRVMLVNLLIGQRAFVRLCSFRRATSVLVLIYASILGRMAWVC